MSVNQVVTRGYGDADSGKKNTDVSGRIVVPSTKFSATEICELALGTIGDFTVNDLAPSPPSMERALRHLDMIIAELSGIDTNWWLVQDDMRFEWPASTQQGTVADVMDDAYPSLGIMSPISARLLDANGVLITELQLVRRHVYEEVSDKARTGQPSILYFDRLAAEPTVSIYPVPDGGVVYLIELTAQTFARSVLGNQNQTNQAGDLQHGFGPEWQRYLVNKLSADTGDGPIRRCPLENVDRWEKAAEQSLAMLQAWANREKKSGPSRVARWG